MTQKNKYNTAAKEENLTKVAIDNAKSSVLNLFKTLLKPKKKLAIIKLSGVIRAGEGSRGGISYCALEKSFNEIENTTNLAGLILIIDSPGGSPVQSELIANRIIHIKKILDIPVIAFIEDIAASGGYWLAASADEIYASSNSIIGSIGVISAGFGFVKAIEKLGIERRVFTQGKNKSVLDPFVPVKKDDVNLIHKIQHEIHGNFIRYIKSQRSSRLTQSDQFLFNGQFWVASAAQDFGLIDGIDNMHNYVYVKYGKDVNLKYFGAKESWIKRKLGISFNIILDMVESKLEQIYLKSSYGL